MTRRTLGAALGLFVVGGLLVTDRPLDVQAIGGLNTVTVSPGHGRAAAQFQVSYTISPCLGAAGLTIAFSWNELPPAGQVLGTAATDSACRATLSATPPLSAAHQGPAPGSYQVFGYVPLPTGAPAPNTEASTTYVVDVTPAPTTSTSSSATARPSASMPKGTGAPTASTPPATSDQRGTGTTAQSDAGNPAASQSSGHHPAFGTLTWPVGVGASVLGLLVLASMGFLAVWLVRPRRVRAAPGPSKDKAA